MKIPGQFSVEINKGTIGRVLTALLGKENIAAPTLTSLTSNFGLQPLLGKLAAAKAAPEFGISMASGARSAETPRRPASAAACRVSVLISTEN